jgi:hypothetical protein
MLMKRLLQALPAVALALFGLSSAVQTISADTRISAVQSGQIAAADAATRLLQRSSVNHSREWIAVAAVLSAEGPENDPVSIALLERAFAADPYHPTVWSLLAYLRVRHANEFSEAAASALREANQRCTLCNRAELKWRLTFTLSNWEQMPEDLRMSAFIGADFLRWWYLEYDYLNQIRDSAQALSIPFDEYRRKVNSPVRPNEIP